MSSCHETRACAGLSRGAAVLADFSCRTSYFFQLQQHIPSTELLKQPEAANGRAEAGLLE